MSRHRLGAALGLAAATALHALAMVASAAPVQVRYMLWDSGQLPAYRQCAAAFTRQHPEITVRIQQAGWGDYWTSMSTDFIAGSAPDVFTNHLSKAPEFMANGLIEDLKPYIVRDHLDTSVYPAALYGAWGRGDRQFALPKDWDTVALLVNLEHAAKSGVGRAELEAMRWNPADGGSFEAVLRRLTRDRQGRSGSDPAFDRSHVAVYGYQNPGPGGMFGQLEWSHWAFSSGFRYQDAAWSTPYHYDDPRLAQTLNWLAGLPAKGLAPPYQGSTGLGASARFASGQVAMIPDGAWMIRHYARSLKFAHAWVPLPVGPTGHRASMLNGLGDSMWVGSKVKEQAWQWIRFLGSPECQQIVAQDGVVLPAYRGLAEQVLARHAAQGIDAKAFLTMTQDQTFSMPVAGHGAQADALIHGAIEAVLMGKAEAGAALREANLKVNALFDKDKIRDKAEIGGLR